MRLSSDYRSRPMTVAGVCLSAAVCLVCNAGCASQGRRGEIPLGSWSGEGFVVCEQWKQHDDDDAETKSLAFRYPTTLTIQSTVLDGHSVIELEIHSIHHVQPGITDTHIKAALVKVKQVSDSLALYRLVDISFKPSSDSKLQDHEDTPPYAASCWSQGDMSILQVAYLDNFVDTFCFRGRHLQKTGVFGDPKEQLVHWSEHLRKQ